MRRAAASASLLLTLLLLAPAAARAESETDVMLLIDLSGTMKRNDPDGYRYVGAEQFLTLLTLFNSFGRNKAGVVIFGNDGRVARPLDYITSDQASHYQSLFSGLRFEDATELGKGLDEALKELTRSGGRTKSMVVISDGWVEGNPSTRRTQDWEQAKAAAEQEMWGDVVPRLKAAGVKVYTIGLFGPAGKDRRGEPTLRRLARETGGFFEAVSDPADFSRIYQKMLYDIETPAELIPMKEPGGRIKLTPGDVGLIITGPKGFSLTDPHGRIYPGAESPVRQEHFEYRDGGAILFLERPSELGGLDQNWTGDWGVNISGEGQVAKLSPVRIVRDASQPPRSFYFKNEYVPLRFGLVVRADADKRTRDLLNACEVKYTLVPEAPGAGGVLAGRLEKVAGADLYAGEQLIEKQGEYRVEIQMICKLDQHGEIKFAQNVEHFDVHPEEVLSLGTYLPDQAGTGDRQEFTLGDWFKVRAGVTQNARDNFPFLKGFKTESFRLKLHYPSGSEQEVPVTVRGDAEPESEDIHFDEWGELTVGAEVRGALVTTQPGRDELISYPFRAKTSKKIRSTLTLWAMAVRAGGWLWKTLAALSVLTGLFVFLRHQQWKRLPQMSLRNEDVDQSLGGDESEIGFGEKLRRDFRHGPRYYIGGPESDAEVKLPGGDGQRIAEIGMAGPPFFERYYVRPLGPKAIHLNGSLLNTGVRATIKRDDLLKIEGMDELKFEPTDPAELD
ncbi:MAG TPA: vWA domain-containing protein [Pyrinomonadaceae bacterium]